MARLREPSDVDVSLRLIGLAFAAADLMFEIDDGGRVTFAMGAAQHLTGRSDVELVGTAWMELFSSADQDLLAVLFKSLKPGERQGPLRVGLHEPTDEAPSRQVWLSLCRLPQTPTKVSCAVSIAGVSGLDAATGADGLIEPGDFQVLADKLIEEAGRAGLPLSLDLVELTGLEARLAGLDAATAEQERRRLAAALRAESYAGSGATEVARDRFALVRSADAPAARLNARLSQAVAGGISPTTARMALDGGSAAQNIRAMRYALDRYIEDGPTAAAEGFKATVERTVRDTLRFKSIVASGAFHLAYQPVVALDDDRVHHFEALARFDADASPADTIRLAEELDLITDFDLAVAQGVAKALKAAKPDISIAANISALSLMRPAFVEALLEVTAKETALRPRLLLEVTETVRLDDLDQAERIISRLRDAGHVVCLDDFGAGAASLEYLRHLKVDFVKIDGRYVRELTDGSRDAMILKHVVGLCRDLKIATIAEMVETRPTARLLKDLGVDLGQGWAFGKPASHPIREAPVAVSARRMGEREQWG